jgi:hypothetical protein
MNGTAGIIPEADKPSAANEGREDAARESRNADDLPNLPAPHARAFLPHAELENGAKCRQFDR